MSVEEAIDLCNEIMQKASEVPEEGEDFAESVAEKAESIKKWIQKHDEVTSAQASSLENMSEALDRWIK